MPKYSKLEKKAIISNNRVIFCIHFLSARCVFVRTKTSCHLLGGIDATIFLR